MVTFIKKVSESKLAQAGSTLGIDEMILAIEVTNSGKKKIYPFKALFGKKNIKFKRPIIQWEQRYQKLNL